MSHLSIHTSEKPYKFGDCLTFYTSKTELSSHKETHLQNEIRVKYPCSNCPLMFKTQRGLIGHR